MYAPPPRWTDTPVPASAGTTARPAQPVSEKQPLADGAGAVAMLPQNGVNGVHGVKASSQPTTVPALTNGATLGPVVDTPATAPRVSAAA